MYVLPVAESVSVVSLESGLRLMLVESGEVSVKGSYEVFGEYEQRQPLTLAHKVSFLSLQPKRYTACFPNHYCLGCHSLGSCIKMIYTFLQAKNSTMTEINRLDS